MLSGLFLNPFLIHPDTQSAFLRAIKWGSDSSTRLFNRKILSLGSSQFKTHRPVYRFALLLCFYLKSQKTMKKQCLAVILHRNQPVSMTWHVASSPSFALVWLMLCPDRISGTVLTICLRFRCVSSGNEGHGFALHSTKARERGDQLFPPTRQQQLLWGWKDIKKNLWILLLLNILHSIVKKEAGE